MQTPPTEEKQNSLSPQQVLKALLEGNARFISGALTSTQADIAQSRTATASGQSPKAFILSCIDSRVPVELVFDQGIGDLFVGRVAGNIENTDLLGSMEFATKLAGSKLILVLGHTRCGAIQGACNGVELGNLTPLLAKIKPAINAVHALKGGEPDSQNSSDKEFISQVIEENVRQTIANIRKKSPVLKELEASGNILITGAVYDLQSGKVRLL